MAQKKANARKDKFLANLPKDEDISNIEDVKGKLSFSFKYFDNSQKAGQDFKDWTDKQKQELLEKLRDYSKESKVYWLKQNSNILAIYGNFPINSDFEYPSHVPENSNIKWARFRMENAMRLIGFFIDDDIAKSKSLSTDIFYVVFLDKDHGFYKTEKR